MQRFLPTSLCLLGVLLFPEVAHATKSAELYTTAPYGYGRYEARLRFAAGDGVVSAFFLWKDGSETAGTFWNELDYEKIGATCQLQSNALYGNPAANHNQVQTSSGDLCSGFHVYAYEWTADYIAWFLDGMEIRRETGATAAAYAENASAGMQIHFNIWPGDASFGGNFNPGILPVHQLMDWVQFSSYADGAFTLAWREDFNAATAPTGWATGNWGSPKNLSTHDPLNVNFLSGCAVISLTADDAPGPAGVMPDTTGCTLGMGGASGAGGSGGMAGTSGAAAGTSAGGAAGGGGSDVAGTGGTTATGGMTSVGGASGSPATTGGASGTGATSSNAGSGAQGPVTTGGTSSGTSGATSNGGTGGATTSSGGSPAGGNPASGGTATTAGQAGDGTKDGDGDGDGCGCRVPGATRSAHRESSLGAALLLALACAFRRRRAPSRGAAR